MKKFFAMMMAGVMTMGMGVTAFAEDTLNYDGSTQAPIIEVTLPTTTALIVNPYKLSVENPADPEGEKINSQIISPTEYIFSSSNVPLTANVTIAGTSAGAATFATADPTTSTKGSTKNEVYLYAEVSEAGNLGAAVTGTEDDDTTVADALGLAFTDGYDAATDVLVGAKSVTKAGMFKLDPATFGDDGSTVEDATVIGLRLAGTANDKAATAWTDADKVNVAFTFNFVPAAVEGEAP